MRPRPATRAASFVDSCSALSPLGDKMTASVRQRSRSLERRSVAVASSELPIRHLAMTKVQPLRRPAALVSCSLPRLRRAHKQRVRGEAATPGQPVALTRVFWSVPRQFTLENRRLPLALPQSSGKLRNSHVSLNPLSATSLRPATEKTSILVQNLWTMCLPCGSPRKSKN